MSRVVTHWEAAHTLRAAAVAACEAGGHAPKILRAVAKAHDVTMRTLSRWRKAAREGLLRARKPGRPAVPVACSVRQGLLLTMIVLGPYISEEVLRGMFVNVPYSFLRSFKQRFKAVMRRRDSLRKGYLQWRQAGRVWAIDFTEPSAKLEGLFNRLLVVRDLASGATLASVPTVNETGRAARTILKMLFALHGAPLVLKFDNGGAFIARKTTELLAAHGVRPMRSPTYRPQYNGSCERGGGHLKVRIEHVAATEGRPGRWSVADVERGRLLANHTARPWGARGPTPQVAFEARTAITPEEREAFLQTCDLLIAEERLRYAGVHGHLPPASKQAVVERRATKRTLLELGYLKIRGGPVSTPLS